MQNNSNYNENNDKKVLYYSISAVVVAFAIIFWLISGNKTNTEVIDQADLSLGDNSVLVNNLDLPSTNTKMIIKKSSSQKIQTPSISYANALAQYADRRIQFDESCQAWPNIVTYKDNTGIMIDNRSKEDVIIKVETAYKVMAYDFKIVVLPDIEQPKNILVDCGNSENVATILIQE